MAVEVGKEHHRRGVPAGGEVDDDSPFGGVAGLLSSGTWLWTDSSWKEAKPATSPPARAGSGLVFDPAANALVLFGGYSPSDNALADTWTWSGLTWVLHRHESPPEARDGAFMNFDGATGQMILFGGEGEYYIRNGGNAQPFGDTWKLVG